MKKLYFLAALLVASITMNAQLSKGEVEGLIKGVNFQEIKDVFLIRTREHDGTKENSWLEKAEKLDPKTCKVTFNEKSLILEGSLYTALVPYDKIKVIFYKKANYLTIELID